MPIFHLYGHSFGGILAFEYIKVAKPNNCLSLTLASAPTSSKLIMQETCRLSVELMKSSESDSEPVDELDPNQRKRSSEAFSKVHECRLEVLPLALQDAYAQAAPASWRGLQAIEIKDYQAETALGQESVTVPPTMILVGEFDFCTNKCIEGWKELLTPPPEVVSVSGCSHYGILEDESEYGKLLFRFLKHNDPK